MTHPRSAWKTKMRRPVHRKNQGLNYATFHGTTLVLLRCNDGTAWVLSGGLGGEWG